MAQLALADRADTRIYSLLSDRVSRILATDAPHEISPADKSDLARATELLERCVAGSRLVEGKLQKQATPPRPAAIRELGYALSTLEALREVAKEKEASAVLDDFLKTLQAINSSNRIEPGSANQLMEFFRVLAQEFLRDLANQEFRSAAPGRFLKARFA
jgi:hypothetical protein